jgi:hypothetical protein
LFGGAFHDIDHRSPMIRAGSDIEKNQFVSTLPVVLFRTFHRITCIPELDKFRALYDTALGYIETRYDSFRQHAEKMTNDR